MTARHNGTTARRISRMIHIATLNRAGKSTAQIEVCTGYSRYEICDVLAMSSRQLAELADGVGLAWPPGAS